MKVVLSWLTWTGSQVNRQRIVVLVGSLCLILSARSPWYKLPPDALDLFATKITLANLYRFLPILFALLGIFLAVWQSRRQSIRLFFWSGLFAILLFPYFLATWTPSAAFLAKNYHRQGARVDLHVEKNFGEIQAQWKQNIKLDKPEKPESTVNFLIKNSSFLQPSSLDRFLKDILAYNPSFFGFMSINWAIAILGFLVILFGLYLEQSDKAMRALVQDAAKFLPWTVLGVVVLGLSVLLPNILDYRLNVAYAKGEYRFVQSMSKTLATLYPPLQGDENFLERMAKAGYYGDRPEVSLVEFAEGLESYRQNNWLNAENHFQSSLALQPQNFLVRGYLATVLLNEGVTNFNDPNRRNAATATDFFERTIQVFPNHTEALYDLMIARSVNGEFDKSVNNALMIIENQKYAQRVRPALLGQAYLHLTWKGFKDNDLKNAWQRYRQSIDEGAWNNVIEGES
jgi:tetratricopeptide (TPR) repeat protein